MTRPKSRPREHLREALLVERSDRADEHLRVRGRARAPCSIADDGAALHRALDLVARLREQLLAMREHEHLPAREPREVREDHRLAGAGRQAHDHAAHAAAARGEHGVDRLALVGAEGGRAFGHGRL